MKGLSVGLKEALRLTFKEISPLPAEMVSLVDSVDRVAATDIQALVDSPSLDVSRKDGFAVIASDVATATSENRVRLGYAGFMSAGGENDVCVRQGTTVRVLTGARIPAGADAVVSDEFVTLEDNDVLFNNFAKSGMNVLPRGGDAASGEYVLRAGRLISPEMAGLLATAGHCAVPVHRTPVVGIIGTGDELVEPGGELADGKLYASNIITLAGWCGRYKMKTRMAVVKDNEEAIYNVLKTMSGETDAMITSGGAWTGERDMIAHVLQQLGWKGLFHRIRIGPGKAAGFGTLSGKPVFILAGGPPSNLMGFLQVALPGLLSLSGHAKPGLPVIRARLASAMSDGDSDWSDFFFGSIEIEDGLPVFYPMEKRCRLSSIANAEAVALIPEGMASVAKGALIDVQLLKCQ